MEVFVPLVVKPALVKTLTRPLRELWEIIDQLVLRLLCLPPRLSVQSSQVNKQKQP